MKENLNEIKVYAVLRILGPGTVTAISHRSGVKKTTVYDSLIRLQRATLVTMNRHRTGRIGRPKAIWSIDG